ncbi:MAG: amidohydrolase family protein [Actinomycetota bacterium]
MRSPSVDIHCHYIPAALIEKIRAEGRAHSIELVDENGDARVAFAQRDSTQSFPEGILDLEGRLRWMDERRIDIQVVSPWMDFSAYVLDPEDGAWLARSLNELTAEAIASHPDRFRAMAAVPLQEPELAAGELAHAVNDLGMRAVEIATSVRGRELDDEGLTPFWQSAEGIGVLVFIHPYGSAGSERLSRYFLANIVGNPAEETAAAAHLIYGGVLERHPRLKVCLTHGGGFLPYQIGRQDRGYASKPDLTAGRLTRAPSGFLGSFMYDTITHGTEALRFLVDRVGPDRVVLGSDYPFPMGDPDPVGSVADAGFDADVEDAILGRNASEVLGLSVAS